MMESFLKKSSSGTLSGNENSIHGWASVGHKSHTAGLAKLLILVIMANGLITNYAPQIGINTGTFCIDVLEIVICFCALIRELSGRTVSGRSMIPDVWVFLLFVLIAVFTLLSVIAVGYYGPGLLTVLRTRFLYWLIAPALFVLVEFVYVDGVLRFFVNCGTVFCCFAIAQALIPNMLDPRLLSVEYDGVLGLSWSEATSSLLLRSNALMGNSIEFGGICVMLFALGLGNIFRNGATPFRIGKVAIIAAGCYFSYSRVACAGIVVVFAVLYFRLYRKPGSGKILTFLVIVAVLGLAGYFVLSGSTLMNRFFGEDVFTQASNASHVSSIGKALDVIADNVLFGTGLGSQTVSISRVISDGWWLQLAAETGLIVLMLYILVYSRITLMAWRSQRYGVGTEEFLAVMILVCLAYFVLASFINSSFVGRADCSLFMCLLGLYLAARDDGAHRPCNSGVLFESQHSTQDWCHS